MDSEASRGKISRNFREIIVTMDENEERNVRFEISIGPLVRIIRSHITFPVRETEREARTKEREREENVDQK